MLADIGNYFDSTIGITIKLATVIINDHRAFLRFATVNKKRLMLQIKIINANIVMRDEKCFLPSQNN